MAQKSILTRCVRRVRRFFRKPIRVFCLHHISESWDPMICPKIDWTSEKYFKDNIEELRKEFTFINLQTAYQKIQNDSIRLKKYAVLTFDDGYASILQSLHWLDSKGIPYTLFLNGRYLDGYSYSPGVKDWMVEHGVDFINQDLLAGFYISETKLASLSQTTCSIGSHGYDHIDATTMTTEEFARQLQNNRDVLSQYHNFIPFHAYTFGKHNDSTNKVLKDYGFIPVLIDGEDNELPASLIHRRLFQINH